MTQGICSLYTSINSVWASRQSATLEHDLIIMSTSLIIHFMKIIMKYNTVESRV